MFIQSINGKTSITVNGYATVTDKPLAITLAEGEAFDMETGFKAISALPIPSDVSHFVWHTGRNYTTVCNRDKTGGTDPLTRLIDGVVLVRTAGQPGI